MILLRTFDFLFGMLRTVVVLVVITTLLYIAYRGTQPMSLPQVPAGMSYWQFMRDRLEAANEVKPAPIWCWNVQLQDWDSQSDPSIQKGGSDLPGIRRRKFSGKL